MKRVRWIIAGLILAFAGIPFLELSGDYPGVTWMIVEGSGNKALSCSLYARFAFHFLGTSIRPSFLINGAGCLLLAFAARSCVQYSKNYKEMMGASAAAAAASFVLPFLPYIFQEKSLLISVLLLFAFLLLAKLVLLVSLANGTKKQADEYLYMELGKDLRFGAETYGFLAAIEFAVTFLTDFSWFQMIRYGALAGEFGIILYISVKLAGYTRKLNLFPDTRENEGQNIDYRKDHKKIS